MNLNKKISIILIILIVIIATLYLSLNFRLPDHQLSKGYWVTIQGKILPSEKIKETDIGIEKYQYVRAYYPYYFKKYLCRGNQIELSKINWETNKTGNYRVSFWLPIEMDIFLTVDCAGCNHQKIHVSPKENVKEVSLLWDNENCLVEEDYSGKDTKTVLERARSLLDYLNGELNNRELNKSRIKEIKQDIDRSWDEVREAESYKEVNKSLLHSYYTHWYAKRADYKLTLFDAEKCIEDTKEVIERKKDSCYVLPFLAYREYQEQNRSIYGELESNRLRYWYPYEYEESEKMREEIMNVYNAEERVGLWLRDCEEAFYSINESLEFQEPYCIRRKISLISINISWLLVVLGIGILVGQRWKQK